MRLRTVIFDVDGTLIDSVDLHAHAWQDAFADFGYRLEFERIRSQIGKGGDQLIPVFIPKSELPRIEPKLDAHRAKLFAERYLQHVRPFPRVPELFRALREDGRRIALASSAKGKELAHYKSLVGIEGLVDVEVSSDQVERSKPQPDIFQAVLERCGNPAPDGCVVIGDTPYDAQAAVRAGLRCVGVLCGGFAEDSLRSAGCIAIHRDPASLLSAFERYGERSLLEQPDPLA